MITTKYWSCCPAIWIRDRRATLQSLSGTILPMNSDSPFWNVQCKTVVKQCCGSGSAWIRVQSVRWTPVKIWPLHADPCRGLATYVKQDCRKPTLLELVRVSDRIYISKFILLWNCILFGKSHHFFCVIFCSSFLISLTISQNMK
jgi:hypothetical protein